MGFWVGAYDAGANYVAKCWQKLISGKSLSESNQWKSEIDGGLRLEVASTNGKTGEEPQAPIEQGREGIDGFSTEQVSDFILTGNGGLLQRLKGSRNLRSKSNGFSVKPLKSLGSCLTSQLLYREHTRMEDYVYSSFSSPCTLAMRPLLVADGGRIISRASIGFSEKTWLENGEEQGGLEGDKARLRSFGYPRRRKQNVRKGQYRRRCAFTTRATTGPFHSQGSTNGMVLFSLGVTVGIVSSIIAAKSNLDKLNELLKQSQNLVQDLHEELEMKESLTVTELTSEDLECQGTNEHSVLNGISTAFSPERKLDKLADCGGKEPDDSKAKYSEARSQIEAELEAELELLELNIKKSSLQRASHYDMFDPDFREGVIQENLKLDKVNWELGRLPDSDHDRSRTPVSHTCEASNAVSPWELSFHLHEVIESRLKARIIDLETELENSQNRVCSMELETIVPKRDSRSQLESSSTEDSPTGVQEGNDFNHPLVTNLSGLASDSYNEAYEEISKMTKTDKDCIYKEKPPFEKKPSEGQTGGDSFLTWRYDVSEKRWSRDSHRDEEMPLAEGFSRSSGSSKISDSEAIKDEENEKHLIKKIFGEIKICYPSLLNAQRLLYSINDYKKISSLDRIEI